MAIEFILAWVVTAEVYWWLRRSKDVLGKAWCVGIPKQSRLIHKVGPGYGAGKMDYLHGNNKTGGQYCAEGLQAKIILAVLFWCP